MIALAIAVAVSMAGADSVQPSGVPLRPHVIEAPAQEVGNPDRWLGEDKFRHFMMSYAITGFAYAGARSVLDRDASMATALVAGSAAGLLKEIHDRSVGQPFSVRDLVWDAAGIALGYVVVRQTR